MKRLLFGLIICFFIIKLSAQQTLVSGKIKGVTSPDIKLSFIDNDLIESQTAYVTDIIDSSEFYILVNEIIELTKVTITYNQQDFEVWVEPNDRLELTFDGSDILNTLEYSGRGANKNKFIEIFNKKHVNQNDRMFFATSHFSYFSALQTTYNANTSENPIAAWNIFIDARQEQIDALQAFEAENPISDEFKEWAIDAINCEYGSGMMAYLKSHAQLINEGYEVLPENFTSFTMDIPFKSKALNNPYYKNYVHAFLDNQFAYQEIDSADKKQEFFDIITTSIGGRTRAYYQAAFLIKAAKAKDISFFNANFGTFLENSPKPEYVEAVEKMFDYHTKLLDGATAADFTVKNKRGNSFSLSDYRGEVVYLSFWASWCAPCLKNFKKYQYIKEHLMEEGVKFVNISMDEKRSVWIKTMKENGAVIGENGIVNNNTDEINTKYGLSTLPAYFVIDKNGNFRELVGDLDEIKDELKKMVVE